jgi:hypothetical protein
MKIRNTILVAILSALVCFGLLPGAKAQDTESALPNGNTADGQGALLSLTTGFYNSAFGFLSLLSNSTGNFNTGIGAGALLLTNGDPAAFDGIENTAVGAGALLTNSTGTDDNAVGAFALFNNTVGNYNNAVGHGALQSNVDGSQNNAFGDLAMFSNTSGGGNTAVGDDALFSCTTGGSNVALGDEAGADLVDGFDNIYIGTGVQPGNASESGFIRIGDNLSSGGIGVLDGGALANFVLIGTGLNTGGISVSTLIGFGNVSIGNGLQTTTGASTCNIGGIFNQTPPAGSHAVVVGPNNQLADATLSSRRFKKDIAPIDKISEGILALRPVTFHWKTDDTNEPEFGLVAEEVAEVNLDWITRNPQGEISGVRYESIPILLLNEFLKEHKKVEEQQANIAELKSTVAQQQKGMEVLTAQLKEQAAQIQKVSAQLEVGKPPTKVALGNQ